MQRVPPFFKAVESPKPIEDLFDKHKKSAELNLGSRQPYLYGVSKMGTHIPDRELKHWTVHSGSSKTSGWGESFPTLEGAFKDHPKSLKGHQDAIKLLNTQKHLKGDSPLQVKGVHVLYAPHRAFIHLANDTHQFVMKYRGAASNGSGQRELTLGQHLPLKHKTPVYHTHGIGFTTHVTFKHHDGYPERTTIPFSRVRDQIPLHAGKIGSKLEDYKIEGL
jgi:hypothetical protein